MNDWFGVMLTGKTWRETSKLVILLQLQRDFSMHRANLPDNRRAAPNHSMGKAFKIFMVPKKESFILSGKYICMVLFVATLWVGCSIDTVSAQDPPPGLRTGHEVLDQKLARMIKADSLALSARQARALTGAVYFDAREAEEFQVSHLPGARLLGFKNPDYSALKGVDKNTPIIVYCTVGYRSEKMAEGLRERGFYQVYNLYGSLYAWKLAGFPLEDGDGQPTERLHTYNRKWSEYVPDDIG